MLGFLKLIPAKDLFYSALLVVALGLFGWYHHSVVVKAQQKILASDNKAAQLQLAHDADVQNAAARAFQAGADNYARTIAQPVLPVRPPVRLCNLPRSPGTVPGTAPADSGGSTAPVVGSSDTSTVDALSRLATSLVTIGRDDDALISALQAENEALRAEMTK